MKRITIEIDNGRKSDQQAAAIINLLNEAEENGELDFTFSVTAEDVKTIAKTE